MGCQSSKSDAERQQACEVQSWKASYKVAGESLGEVVPKPLGDECRKSHNLPVDQQEAEDWETEQARRRLLVDIHLLRRQQQKDATRDSLAYLHTAGEDFIPAAALPAYAQRSQLRNGQHKPLQIGGPPAACLDAYFGGDHRSTSLATIMELTSPQNQPLSFDLAREVQRRMQAEGDPAWKRRVGLSGPEAQSTSVAASSSEEAEGLDSPPESPQHSFPAN